MRKKIVILGAGISGLSLAWFLKKRHGENLGITILEKGDRPGGRVQSVHHEGFLFERGPRSCRPKGAGIATLQLVEDLGLQDQVIVGDSSSRHRYLWMDKKLQPLPSGFASFLFSPLMRGVVPALIRDLFAPISQSDPSIYEFISRRLSSTLAERLVDPMTSGIYAGDIRQLSMKSCFPILHQWEQEHGSLLRGAFAKRKQATSTQSPFVQEMQKHSLFSLKKGMGALTQELANRLEGDLLLSSNATGLSFHTDRVEVTLSDGRTLEADHLFSTIPATSIASLVAPHHFELSNILKSIPSASVAGVNLGYRKSVLKKQGFGYLIPSKEKEDIMGVVWDSCIFPQQNHHPDETRLTVMVGGSRMLKFDQYNTEDFTRMALEAVSRHLKIETSPDAVHVHIAKSAIPQYLVGHSEKLTAIEDILTKNFPNLSLSGNSFYGVSVNDCIAHGKKITEEASIFS